jgi:hypothetical protein
MGFVSGFCKQINRRSDSKKHGLYLVVNKYLKVPSNTILLQSFPSDCSCQLFDI